MSPILRLAVGIGLLAVLLLAVAFALPQHLSVARSIAINAPEYDIFPYVNDLHRFKEWSPWAATDPNMQYAYSGPQEGVGARMAWRSEEFGSGSQEILESHTNSYVKSHVNSDGVGAATFAYQLSPAGAGTKVTWFFDTDMGNNPLRRWRGLVYAPSIGADFEQGLQRLKQVAEARR